MQCVRRMLGTVQCKLACGTYVIIAYYALTCIGQRLTCGMHMRVKMCLV